MFQRQDKGKARARYPKETFTRKVIFVGEHRVGKTTLIYNLKGGYGTNEFISTYLDGVVVDVYPPPVHLPTEEKGFYITNVLKSKKGKWPPRELEENYIDLFCFDLPPHEDYDRLRPIYYVGTHLIALCAAVDDKKSLRAIIERWLPELAHHLPGVPIILIGTRSDMRTRRRQGDEKQEGFTVEEGKTMARQIGARGYIEYSAERGNIEPLFEVLTYYAFETWTPPKPKKKNWFLANFVPVVK